MDCPDVMELDRFASDELDPGASARITSHLSACSDCRTKLEDIEANERLGADLRTAAIASHDAWRMPESLRNYRILREIGRGGMGVVFEAEQLHPHRLVALKVLDPIRFAGRAGTAMLQREVRALARLAHPGIAAIHDAGELDDGRAYFVMELVDGVPLTRFAIERELPRDRRIELFVELCRAAAHAHRRGVLHGDIKPANVLVDTTGRPRLLDFGLARIVEGDGDEPVPTASIAHGHVEGTLPYMSPEKVRGAAHAVDLRSDVYSLGVVLYELLFERLPYEISRTSFPDAARTICETAPTQPRTIDRKLPPDLETIVLCALEKDVERRYASADELAAELERFRSGLPINAHPPSAWYQLRRLVGRHRVVATLAAALAVITVAAAIGTGVLYSRSERARQLAVEEGERARREAETSRRVRDFVVELFESATPLGSEGRDMPAGELLDEGAARLASGLEDEPAVRLALHGALGRSYRGLDDHRRAEHELSLAYEDAQRLRPRHPIERAVAASELASVRIELDDFDGARRLLTEALEECANDDPRAREAAASVHERIALLRWREDDLAGAEESFRTAIRLLEECDAPDPVDLAGVRSSLASLLAGTGRTDEARTLVRSAVESARRELGLHPDVASAVNSEGLLRYATRDFVGAEESFREALSLAEQLGMGTHTRTATFWNNLAIVLQATDREPEAEQALRRAAELFEAGLGDASAKTATACGNLARSVYLQKRYAEAEELCRRALAMRERALPAGHTDVADSLEVLGLVLQRLKRWDEALATFDRGLAILEDAGRGAERRALANRVFRGECLHALGRDEEARRWLTDAWHRLDPLVRRDDSSRRRCAAVLVRVMQRLGDEEAAAEWRAHLDAAR